MTITSLTEVLSDALKNSYAVPGFVVLGWEDALYFVKAGEKINHPIILQAGPKCRSYIPIKVLGSMFRYLAENSTIPVVCHLDHGNTVDEIKEAIDCGFNSVMIDGSKLDLHSNITLTSKVVKVAHLNGVCVEAEIGYVGYTEDKSGTLTQPNEAKIFYENTGVDALAVSVGNIHLATTASNELDITLLKEIENLVPCPLVLHGGSGILEEIRHKVSVETSVCKINIGTEIRKVFGTEIRSFLGKNPEVFDRLEILESYGDSHMQETIKNISLLRSTK